MNRRKFLGGLVGAGVGSAAVAAGVAKSGTFGRKGAGGIPAAAGSEERRRRLFQNLNVPLRTHEGKDVMFYDDLIKGKTVIIQLMYTSDEDRSARATANLSQLQKLLGNRLGRDVFIYSVTQDPDRDTPEVLAEYARRFEARPGWLFLTTRKETAAAGFANATSSVQRYLCTTNVQAPGEDTRDEFTGFLRIGIDPMERWGCAPALVRPEVIALHLSWIEPKGERPDGSSRGKQA